MRWMLTVLMLAAVAAGCGGQSVSGDGADPSSESSADPSSESSTGDGGSSSDESSDDAGGELACTHFRNVAGDASAGVLTNAELREKLKEVHNDARVSESPKIRQQSEAMLAAVTQGDTEAASEAITAFAEACADLGF